MAIITFPPALLVNRQTWGQKRFDLRFQNGDSGAGQSRILAPARWMASISCHADLTAAESAAWRALILDLDGQVNQLALYDQINTAPQGTLRGALTLTAQATAGASALSLTGGAGQAAKTLLRGDWLGIGSGSTRQLVAVAADVTTNGAGTVTVAVKPGVRWTQAISSAVVWDKPTALFRNTASQNSWDAGVFEGGYSLDLMESWE